MATNFPGVSEESMKLYLECISTLKKDKDGARKVFNQDELSELTTADLPALLVMIHELTENALFISLKQQGKVCWATRPRDSALKVRGLNKEERMVYQVIEESHLEGVWIKKIKQKLGIYDNSVEKMVNRFMSLNLIKCIRTMKAPLQKTYILFHLAPGDEITGGSFYDQGDLDESMVDELANVIVMHVRSLSWREVKRKHGKREAPSDAAATRTGDQLSSSGKKRKRGDDAQEDDDDNDSTSKRIALKTAFDLEPHASSIQFAFPAGHNYPSTNDILDFISDSGILSSMSNKKLAAEEIQQIINVLVWDDKLEAVNGGYRTVRGVREQPQGGWSERSLERQILERKQANGFTEVPCGRCPVIDLCGTGGPVSAENCEQFDKWLKMF